MKKLLFLNFVALCILIASCSKDSGFMPGSDPSLAFSKGYPAHGPVINYSPATDGDDTDDLLDVINSAEPGTVIKLAPGEFHVGSMEILGFTGKIMGSGTDKTIIRLKGTIDQNSQIAINLMPCWIRIIGGDVVLSDFTFKTGDGSLVREPGDYKESLTSMIVVNNYCNNYGLDDPQPMHFTMKDVSFLCGNMDLEDSFLGMGYNVLMAFWIGFPYWYTPDGGYILTKGNYNVSNCYFENAFQGIETIGCGGEAVCTFDKVRTKNCPFGAYFTANFNSITNITNCRFDQTGILGVTIEDNDWGFFGGNIIPYKRSEYRISGNTFNPLSSSQALIIRDYWGVTNPDLYEPTLAVIKNNLFNLSEGCIGISCENNVGGQVRNNRFCGAGNIGVNVNGVTLYDWLGTELGTGEASNVLILGNNFSGFNASTSDIYLGELSSHCTVVGSGKENVVDLGDFNKIVGMKKKPGGHHIGPTIRDNFRMWHGMRH